MLNDPMYLWGLPKSARLDHVQTWDGARREEKAFAPAHSPRVTLGAWIGLLAIVGALITARAFAAGPAECRTLPNATLFRPETNATMTLKAGTACSIWLRPSAAAVERIELVTPPAHGVVTPRGRTGMVYRANANFSGEDFFAFALHGRSSAYSGAGHVRVRVNVR